MDKQTDAANNTTRIACKAKAEFEFELYVWLYIEFNEYKKYFDIFFPVMNLYWQSESILFESKFIHTKH